ncbi:MAG: hypothetical protein IKI93_06120, partial [Clostridia bacterium]|nr:hypothetical protein [Clostridia bacterium]
MKHSHTKRLLSLILAALMLGGAFVGCANEETIEQTDETDAANEAAETDAPEETEKKYLDNLPEGMNYDGAEIRFVTAIEKISIEVTDDDITGDILTDAYWKRNEALASRMNVKPVVSEKVGYGGIIPAVTQSVTAASDDYDIISGCASATLSLATSHYVVNLDKTGYTEYIDVSQPYWSEKMVSNINYKDNLYWLAGDMTHSIIQETYAMFVNAMVWNNYHAGESVYDLVFDGKWTLDTMAQYAEGANQDHNGDGVYDKNDSYGV